MSSRDPFDELTRLVDRMNERFGALDVPRPGGGFVPVDVEVRSDEYVVTVDLPGYDPASIDVELDDRTLTLTAERDLDATPDVDGADGTDGTDEPEAAGIQTEPDAGYVRRERQREHASRTIRLPDPVDESATSATYENGVLTVHLPRETEEDGGISIPVE